MGLVTITSQGEQMRPGSGPGSGTSLRQTARGRLEVQASSVPSLQRGTMKDPSQTGSLGQTGWVLGSDRGELQARGQEESQATHKVKVALGLSPDWALPSGLNPTTPSQAWAAPEIRAPGPPQQLPHWVISTACAGADRRGLPRRLASGHLSTPSLPTAQKFLSVGADSAPPGPGGWK